MEVGGGEERLYTYRYTVITRMTSAFRWAATKAILMFHNCDEQSHRTVSTDHNLSSEKRAEADSNRGPSAYQPTAFPLGQTGSRALGLGSSPFEAATCAFVIYFSVFLFYFRTHHQAFWKQRSDCVW